LVFCALFCSSFLVIIISASAALFGQYFSSSLAYSSNSRWKLLGLTYFLKSEKLLSHTAST
jgi:hypothetical protein